MNSLIVGILVLLVDPNTRLPAVPCVVTGVQEYMGDRSYEVTCFNPTASGQPVIEQWRGLYLRDDRGTWDDVPHLVKVQP